MIRLKDDKLNFLQEINLSTSSNRVRMGNINDKKNKETIDKDSKNGYVIVSPCCGYEQSGIKPCGEDSKLALSDFKGKYVFIDFWASWCAPCRREIPYLKEVLAYSEKSDNLVVLSYSIDSKEKDWLACIKNNNLIHKNWIHISTLKGWNTEAIKLFGVKGVPFTALIDPDGNVVEFKLRGEEMVKKLKNIIDSANK